MFKKLLILTVALMMLSSPVFAYTRDWSNSTPVDHTLNKNWPGNDRNIKADVSERLDDIMNGFASGDTVTDFNLVPMNNRAADPAGVADTGIFYTKDVSAKAEAFYVDEDDNVIQLTTVGGINTAALKADSVSDLSVIMEYIYPIGSVVTLGVSTNPGTLFGVGTWTPIEGKVIVGISDEVGDTAFDTLDETGGEQEHTITLDELPTTVLGFGSQFSANALSGTQRFTPNPVGTFGGGTAVSVLQPYIVKYVWQRTS